VKIKEIRAFEIALNPTPITTPRQLSQTQGSKMARPIRRYDRFKDAASSSASPEWHRPACLVVAEDGTWGFGLSIHGGPVVRIINDHFAPNLVGEDCMATEKLWDMMVRMAMPYGAVGLASYAISAVDVALWDLKGKLLQKPVYELLGGPQKEKIFCYATGYDTEWYLELGFKATKIFATHGPEDGLDGLRKNEELVAQTRELVGDEVELMLDCWLAMDVDYLVRLAERLRPYRLKWIEDYISPIDWVGYRQIRQRLPWQTLASGEHWYLPTTFANAAHDQLVDIFQPDVLWGGGITAAVKICHLAEASGIAVITHAGMNYPYGQHLAYAMPAVVWGERSEGVSPPGVPLAEMTKLPGTPAIRDGYVRPSDAPGFGLEIDQAWLEAVTVKV
jgi:L-rhamnonate dehydratase